MGNKHLQDCKDRKNDEFYTLMSDIEAELSHYKEFLENKKVYLNCDDPRHSKFWEYFMEHFDDLKLKSVMASYLDKDDDSCVTMYEKGMEKPHISTIADGSFDSSICRALINEADIIVTNPPFSLFRVYMNTLLESQKEFIVIGPPNATTYKDIFPHIKSGKLKIGYTKPKKFKTPEGSIAKQNACWFTNLPVEPKPPLILTKKYYDNEGTAENEI